MNRGHNKVPKQPILIVKLNSEVCTYLNVVHLETEHYLQMINHMVSTRDVIAWGELLVQYQEKYKKSCMEKQLIFDEIQSTLPMELTEQYPNITLEVDFREEVVKVYA